MTDHREVKPDVRIKMLPPNPEGMNGDRAQWAEVAIEAFMKETGCGAGEALGDLLCNLMHWTDRSGHDFNLALDRAVDNYVEETRL